MFAKTAEWLTESMENNHIIEHDDRELYVYGFNQGLNILLNLITTLVVGLLFHNVLELAIFIAAYIPLRSFAGGYHAKTPVRCYIFSIILILVFVLATKYVHFTIFVYSIIIVASSVIILYLAPVEDKNKPLDTKEQRVYRKRTYMIWVTELAVTVICCCLKQIVPVVCLTMTFLVMAVMLILGKLKNMLL